MNRQERRRARKQRRRKKDKRRTQRRRMRERLCTLDFRVQEQERYIKQIEDGAVRTAVDLAYTRAAVRLAQMRADEAQIRALEAERQTQDMAEELAAWRRKARGAERAQA